MIYLLFIFIAFAVLDVSSGFVPTKIKTVTTRLNLGSMEGCVAIVTGASRGIGKGIAIELGKAGAVVYVTGTSTVDVNMKDGGGRYSTNDEVGGPGSIEETANEVTRAGGLGIPVYCNHADDEQVKNLFDLVEDSHGRLDLLVNNVFRVPQGGTKALFGNFWEKDIEVWDSIHTVGCRSHYVASCHAVPLMKKNRPFGKGDMKRPMIAMISSFGGLCYTFNVAYGVGKAAVDRMAKDMAVELEKEDIVCMSFWPGVVRTERTEISVQNGVWDKDVGIPLDNAETPGFTGKAIVAVATDKDNTSKSGKYHVVAELAQDYGFTDENGKQPPSIRSLRFLIPAYGLNENTRDKIPLDLIPDWKIPFFIMANGKPPDK
jgi:dehydrogenase/reductase SDR family member 1